MKLLYKAPLFDMTGLGEASRMLYDVLNQEDLFESIKVAVIDIAPSPSHYMPKIKKEDQISKNYPFTNREYEYDAVLSFCPPYQIHKFVEQGKFNIGYSMWETDKLEQVFQDNVGLLNMLFVPCSSNYLTFYGSCQEVHQIPLPVPPICPTVKKNSEFTFYSILDWVDRKGPLEMLCAYFLEFYGHTDTNLVVKTCCKQNCYGQIEMLQKTMRLASYPRFEIINAEWSDDQMHELHEKSHCFVCLSKCESWGIPLMDAIFHRNLAVASHPLGFSEYLIDIPTFYPVNTIIQPVMGMTYFPYINASHNWQMPVINHARQQMRMAYLDYSCKDELLQKALDEPLQQLSDLLSHQKIAEKIKDHISCVVI